MFGILVFLSASVSFLTRAQTNDTFRLYFDLNIPTLNQSIKERIDLLIYNNKIINSNEILIIGYADYLGTEEHNKSLSVERSKNVKKYLVGHGVKSDDVKLCVGKGQVNRDGPHDKEGYPTDRRVDIVVKHDSRSAPGDTHEPDKKPGSKHDNPVTRKDTPVVIRKVIISDIGQISKLKAGSVIVLQNVYFPADRHIIKTESYSALQKLAQIMKDNPNLKISIEGHVCCISDAPDAFDIDTGEPTLSVNRAKAIYDYLVKEGIEESRLQYEGFGKTRPVVQYERTEEDAEKNRRVEIRIVENKP